MQPRRTTSLEDDMGRLRAYVSQQLAEKHAIRQRLEERSIVERAGTGFQLRAAGINVPLARPRSAKFMFYKVDAARIEPLTA